MPEKNPIQNDARRKAREKALGPNARCLRCGESQWETLVPVRKTLLEAHHIVGKANDATLTVALCRNCHAIQTERLRQSGVSMDAPTSPVERYAATLRGLAVLFTDLAPRLHAMADELEAVSASPTGRRASK